MYFKIKYTLRNETFERTHNLEETLNLFRDFNKKEDLLRKEEQLTNDVNYVEFSLGCYPYPDYQYTKKVSKGYWSDQILDILDVSCDSLDFNKEALIKGLSKLADFRSRSCMTSSELEMYFKLFLIFTEFTK
jgi:hypothetical protein